MKERLHFDNWGDDMTGALRQSFVADESWPLCPASLAALIDLGMPDGKIGEYFGIAAGKVTALRRQYGLRRTAGG